MQQVLIVFSGSELGGAERSLTRMALASSKVSYRLASIKAEGAWSDWLASQKVEPILFGINNGSELGFMVSVLRLVKYLRSAKPNLVYVCGFRLSVAVRLLKFLFSSVKLIHAVRWNPISHSLLDRCFRLIERSTKVLVDGWVTNSVATATTLTRQCKVSVSAIEVIYNGIDYRPKPIIWANKPLEVLTIANLSPRKGHREFLKVVAQVVERLPAVKFIFIGRDDMNGEVQQAIITANLQRSVSYQGFQENPSYWLSRCRLFILPSLWGEGCPTAILEAYSHAIPVIAHDIDGVSELVNHGDDGYLLPVASMDMANSIVSLLTDDERSQTMGLNGRHKIQKEFTLQACVDKHYDYFNRIG